MINKKGSIEISVTAVCVICLWSVAVVLTLRMEKEQSMVFLCYCFFFFLTPPPTHTACSVSLQLWQVHHFNQNCCLLAIIHELTNDILFIYLFPCSTHCPLCFSILCSCFLCSVTYHFAVHVRIVWSSFSVSLRLSFSSSCHVFILRCCRGPPCSSYSRCR